MIPQIPRCDRYQVHIDGLAEPVYRVQKASFGVLQFGGAATIEIDLPSAAEAPVLRPASLGLAPLREGQRLTLNMAGPQSFMVDLPGQAPLYVFAGAPDPEPPDPADPAVHYFGGRQVHDVGILEPGAGETVYIEHGSVLRGAIHASAADHLTIAGNGILDGGCFTRGANSQRSIRVEHSRDLTIRGLTMVRPSTWMVVLGDCEGIHVDGIKQLGEGVGSDGIDLVGSRHALIENTFQRNNDDCVVIKAADPRPRGRGRFDWRHDVHDVLVRHCTFYNDHAGNAMEIGFELRTDHVHDVIFRDIDVIGAHGEGAVCAIHNGEHAHVHDILWEDIRVEHFYGRFCDFRVFDSRYSQEPERGCISDVTLRHVRAREDIYNTPSLIGGFDASHRVSGVHFEDVRFGDRPIDGPDALHLFHNAHTDDITFA